MMSKRYGKLNAFPLMQSTSCPVLPADPDKLSAFFFSTFSLRFLYSSVILHLEMTTTIDFPMSLSRTPSRDLLFTQKPKKKLGSLSNLGQKECLATGQLRIKSQIKEESEIYTIKFSPGDEVLAYGMGDGRIKVGSHHSCQPRSGNFPELIAALRSYHPQQQIQSTP